MSVPLTRVIRGGEVESVHRGSIAIVDAAGRLIAFAGDPTMRASLRSAAKPFQAIPLLEYGGAEEFELSEEEIALTCASHGGEPMHVATAAALLRKGEFDEEDLLCGIHMPFDEKSAADLRAAGESPSPLHNNCSGKHAGMLLATQVMDVPSAGYIDAGHPLQKLMHQTVADFGGMPVDEVPVVIDGCGVAAFFLPLHRAAWAYARLMGSALERYATSCADIVHAMTSFPEYVAGNWSLTTPLMRAFGGELLAKEGAEGFYAMALSSTLAAEVSETLHLAEPTALGIAIKIDDGSMSRGRNPVILAALEAMGINLEARPELQRWREGRLYNHAGTVVGSVRPEFELEVL